MKTKYRVLEEFRTGSLNLYALLGVECSCKARWTISPTLLHHSIVNNSTRHCTLELTLADIDDNATLNWVRIDPHTTFRTHLCREVVCP